MPVANIFIEMAVAQLAIVVPRIEVGGERSGFTFAGIVQVRAVRGNKHRLAD